MKHWILAGDGSADANDLPWAVVPETFGLWLEAGEAGLRVEDRVFIWQTNPDAGVVGMAEVDAVLYTRGGTPGDCWVRYLTRALKPPVSRLRIKEQLANMRLPEAEAAFELLELTLDQATALYRIVAGDAPGVADTWPDLLSAPLPPDPDDLLLAAKEGRAEWRAHLRRERNRAIVAAKRRSVLKREGRLACEVCGFDFRKTYGKLGRDYCEVHHRQPLHLATEGQETKLADLAIVCSNCHKMLHRSDPVLSVAELKALLADGDA